MTIRQIVAVSEKGRCADNLVEAAVALAQRLDAMIVFVYLIGSSDGPRYAGGLTLGAVMQETAKREEVEASDLRERLGQAVRRHGLRTEWRLARGIPTEQAILHARYSDLVIAAQADPDCQMGCFRLQPERILLAAGCPLLLVPRTGTIGALGRRVLVAWNASREAARAVTDAMPVLQAADRVDIVLVNPDGAEDWPRRHGDEPGADIATRLARHGVQAEVHVERTKGDSVGQRLIACAGALDCDLIVCGAYGYSRLSEFLLGGVTRFLLNNAAVPLFMSK